MYCEQYGKECPFTMDGTREPECVHHGVCPEEENEEFIKDFNEEMERLKAEEAKEYVYHLKHIMSTYWERYCEEMRKGNDVELDDSYFEAEFALKSMGINYDPTA